MATRAIVPVDDPSTFAIEKALKQLKRAMGPELKGFRHNGRHQAFIPPSERARRKRAQAARRKREEERIDPMIASALQSEYLNMELERAVAKTRQRLGPHAKLSQDKILRLAAKSQGALSIVRIMETPPLFIVQQDVDKGGKYGFCYGSKDDAAHGIVDANICETAAREIREENFNGVGVHIVVTEDNIFDVHHFEKGYTSTWFAVDVPAGTALAKSDEQVWIDAWPALVIDECVGKGLFLDQHALAWQVYKAKQLHEL